MRQILGEAGIIPQPPPPFGRRNQNLAAEEAETEREDVHAAAIENFKKFGKSETGVFIK
jgi:hypothetical protein